MALIFLTFAGVLAGYAIPVLASLAFSLAMGKLAPRFLAQGGRIKPGFVVAHGLVWLLACVVSAFVICKVVPSLRPLACLIEAAVLTFALVANLDAMKKKQTTLQIGGMVAGTVVGLAGGLLLYLRTV